jgi:hypothetical protein
MKLGVLLAQPRVLLMEISRAVETDTPSGAFGVPERGDAALTVRDERGTQIVMSFALGHENKLWSQRENRVRSGSQITPPTGRGKIAHQGDTIGVLDEPLSIASILLTDHAAGSIRWGTRHRGSAIDAPACRKGRPGAIRREIQFGTPRTATGTGTASSRIQESRSKLELIKHAGCPRQPGPTVASGSRRTSHIEPTWSPFTSNGRPKSTPSYPVSDFWWLDDDASGRPDLRRSLV